MKITINNEEVLCDKNIKITEEMLNTSSTILNNVYPKTWESTHNYTQYYYPKDYSQCLIWSDKKRDASINGETSQDTPNLFDKSTAVSGERFDPNGLIYYDANCGRSDYIEVSPNYSYTKNISASAYECICFYDSNYTFISRDTTHTTFTPPSNARYIRISFYLTNLDTLTLIKDITPTNPVPIVNLTGETNVVVNNKTYTVDLGDIELCSIGTYVDRIYNVGEDWYLYKAIGKVVLDGSETWNYNSFNQGFLIPTTDNTFSLRNLNVYNGYCNYFSVSKNSTTWTNVNYCGWNSGGTFWLKDNGAIATSVDDFKVWLSDNKPVVYYVLATPTTTQITNENLINQLNALIKDLLFSGVAKRTGNISLNPFHAHYCDLQVLDYKTLLSEGDTLDYVIADKTVEEAIDMVIESVSDYGFIKGNISIPDNFTMGTYNTQEKTAYDVFQYISDITQTKWTTRVINQNTVAIDFYNPYDKTPVGTIDSTQQYFKDNNIIDITYNYSTEDYRNKQVMTSNEVVSSITQTFRVYADGVNKTFDIGQTIGDISYAYYTTSTDFVICDVITKAEQEQGYSGDIIYTPGETTFETDDKLANGVVITLEINLLVPGRQIALNEPEISRIATQNNRKGVISRYENRDDTKSSVELQRIAQSYIEYKGKAEITLTVQTQNVRLCNIGDIMIYNSSLPALNDNYMCKKVETEMIMTTGDIFYTFEFSNTYNTENAINYFDNQRNKTLGNISDGQTITRNLDIENTLDIVFFDTEVS